MTTTPHTSPIILIAGHWLGSWAWDYVLAHLDTPRCPVASLTLPGLDPADPHRESRTLDDQAVAIMHEMETLGVAVDRPAILVAHSGANGPVSLVLDRAPELVRRIVWVDSGPVASGSAFAPDLADELNALPLPPFDVLGQQASLEGLGDAVLERFRERAVAEPGPVLRAPVVLTNDARRRVATTLVCCSISGEQVLQLARDGHPMFAEVAELSHVDVVDLPTGHWPMWSRARELAAVLEAEAARVG
ncbi:alpha/beta fold hydrolase [Leucobacter musarum]|uniref:alpha/beta fold hydrolase n=1 Tax=Leucobacter musarum TaxID=1930747 RepID=UPI0006A7773C|nr:alpha/beta fold hydrolase [Leucobacter musarum]